MKTFDKHTLTEILNTDECDIGLQPESRLVETRATGRTFEDGLVEEWKGVLKWEDDKFYLVTYRKASQYYTSQCGDDDSGPLDHIQADTVDCEEVFPHQVTKIVYKNFPQE